MLFKGTMWDPKSKQYVGTVDYGTATLRLNMGHFYGEERERLHYGDSKIQIQQNVYSCNHKGSTIEELQPTQICDDIQVSQDHIELLFNKIQRCCGWNNPNVLQLKYALQRILIWNSIEPSTTGNCINFDGGLCDSTGYLDFSSKLKEHISHETDVQYDAEIQNAETMMIYIDHQSPNDLKDSILYYMAGHIVQVILLKLQCLQCKKELLFDPDDPNALKMPSYPRYTSFARLRQKGGLIIPSPALMHIIKSTEVIFREHIVCNECGITTERNINLKIETGVVEQLGYTVFTTDNAHYLEHHIGQERDHLSSLMRLIIRKYLNLRLKTWKIVH